MVSGGERHYSIRLSPGLHIENLSQATSVTTGDGDITLSVVGAVPSARPASTNRYGSTPRLRSALYHVHRFQVCDKTTLTFCVCPSGARPARRLTTAGRHRHQLLFPTKCWPRRFVGNLVAAMCGGVAEDGKPRHDQPFECGAFLAAAKQKLNVHQASSICLDFFRGYSVLLRILRSTSPPPCPHNTLAYEAKPSSTSC